MLPLAAAPAAPAVTTSSHAGAAAGSYVTGVRIGRHAHYDRLVLDIHGAIPTYTISYVRRIIADGSGKRVPLLGRAKLHVVLKGTNTSVNQPQGTWTPRYPEIRQVKGAGAFEGTTSYGVGVTARRPYHAFSLRSPNRIVIDVRHPR